MSSFYAVYLKTYPSRRVFRVSSLDESSLLNKLGMQAMVAEGKAKAIGLSEASAGKALELYFDLIRLFSYYSPSSCRSSDLLH